MISSDVSWKSWSGSILPVHLALGRHFSPIGSSWINRAERWSDRLTDRLIRHGVHTLKTDISVWIRTCNEDPGSLVRIRTTEGPGNPLLECTIEISGVLTR